MGFVLKRVLLGWGVEEGARERNKLGGMKDRPSS